MEQRMDAITQSLNFWANPLSQYSHNIHQIEYEHMLFQPSNCCITTPTSVWVKADHLYSTHHRLSQDAQSCTAQLSHVFTVVNKRLAGVIFILFTEPKRRKNNPLPTATTSSVPRGLQPRQQNKEEYFKKNAALRITQRFESASDSKGKVLHQQPLQVL